MPKLRWKPDKHTLSRYYMDADLTDQVFYTAEVLWEDGRWWTRLEGPTEVREYSRGFANLDTAKRFIVKKLVRVLERESQRLADMAEDAWEMIRL